MMVAWLCAGTSPSPAAIIMFLASVAKLCASADTATNGTVASLTMFPMPIRSKNDEGEMKKKSLSLSPLGKIVSTLRSLSRVGGHWSRSPSVSLKTLGSRASSNRVNLYLQEKN